MKNLSLCEITSKALDVDSQEPLSICYGHDEERSCGEIFACTHNLLVHNIDENGCVRWTKDLADVVCSADNAPLNVTYLTLSNSLCIGLVNGELVTVNGSGETCNLEGVCDHKLLAMEWSPDQEFLVLVTNELNAILMSYTFDIIKEVNLLSEEFGEKQFITVGWGKKETQFHGSAGKQAAKTITEVLADPESQNDMVKISWRGDCQLYAVGFSFEGIRRFKVFDREGQLQFTSEKQPGLESNLAWKPSGSVIATTQKSDKEYTVSFFEKNGLKHGGFPLPTPSSIKVEDLVWSSDSEILAVQTLNLCDSTQQIMLYTSSNYHWYLKQNLEFNQTQRVRKILWDNDFDVANNKKLHVFLSSGEVVSYTWAWKVHHSVGCTNSDDAVVGVIDGKKVLLTGFRQTVVPPPMASLEVELPAFVDSVHFAPRSQEIDTNKFFVVSRTSGTVFEQKCKFPLKYEQSQTFSINKYEIPMQCYNWHWVNNETIVCVQLDKDSYNLLEYKLKAESMFLENSTGLPAAVSDIQQHPLESSKVFLILNSGEIIEYSIGGDIVPQDFIFSAPCVKFNVISVDGELIFLGLTYKNSLFINSIVMNNVSSLFVHTHFLLLTTLKHVLLCVELTNVIEAMNQYQKTAESPHVYQRKVERGSKLVIAVPNDTRTVFQMPRGNLEAIQPRPLSLKIIAGHLDGLKYYEAFDLMRKQRINLNLIYDHDPDKFLQNIQTFLDAIKNTTWLSLFISDLENIDVTKTMYASSYANKLSRYDVEDKIIKVCDVIRDNLQSRDDKDKTVLPLLTTYVKKNTPTDLENALTIVKELKERESGGQKLSVGSDEALKYLLYMVEVEKLFDVALGMYDFDLVLFVANKSQKDPKEFIPMLNELNVMDQNYKKFNINKHLKRFDRAVEFLAKCGKERYDELKAFVKFHSLYTTALDLFSDEDEIYKEIADDFGAYLKLQKHYTEAGIIYRRARRDEKALECFKLALEWELALELAVNMPDLETICWDLIKLLEEENRHEESLMIMERYCKEPDRTIEYATKYGQYKTALRLCAQHQRHNFRTNTLLPTLLKDYESLYELIKTNWSVFIVYKDRLSVVRETKAKKKFEVIDPSYNNKDSDLYSDAGSTVASTSSRSSGRSHRSSKNRRKMERKVASLKEGSQYEDLALIMALHKLVTSSFALRTHVHRVSVALSLCAKNKETIALQRALQTLMKYMKDSFKEIWTDQLLLDAVTADISAHETPDGLPQGIATLDPIMRIAPMVSEVKWKMDGFK